MFQPNERHRQHGLFDTGQHLAPALREDLRTSWAEVFYHEVFCRIDESIFADLYSDTASRPNAPVNVLMAMDILKSGFGWSDRELEEQVKFNVQVRHALGLGDLTEAPPRLRTLYNFRRRVRSEAEDAGINLYEAIFEQVTDEQLEAVGVKTEWQRMDSTQVLSNLARASRLELILAVVRKVYGLMGDPVQARFEERLAGYVEKRPHEVAYRIPAGEAEEHLQKLGHLLAQLAEELAQEELAQEELAQEELAQEELAQEELAQEEPENEGDLSEAAQLAERVLREQYVVSPEGRIRLRAPGQISAESLQSPHDPEATYRKKGGESYAGGYVVNISETCDPGQIAQLITDLQVAPNTTDDADLMAASLESQSGRDVAVEQVTTDGGYTGPTGEEVCSGHDVQLRPTRLRGGRGDPDRLGWDDYAWETGEDGEPTQVTCPQGQTAEVEAGNAEGRFIARFDGATCEDCPLFRGACRVHERKRVGPTLYLWKRAVEVALMRQRLCTEDRKVRAVVEATVRSVKRPCTEAGKLPVRGQMRAAMVLYGSALMVNLRRLHRLWVRTRGKRGAAGGEGPLFVFLLFLKLCWVYPRGAHQY